FILFHFTDTYYTNIYFLSLHDALPIFQTVKNLVNEFSEVVKNKSNELNSELNQKIESLKVELQKWSEKEKEIQEKIDLKKYQFEDRKSTRLNSSHVKISYAVFCLKKKQ